MQCLAQSKRNETPDASLPTRCGAFRFPVTPASTAAIILDLAMVVATTMAMIIGTRGGDGGAASGGEHGGAAGEKTRCLGPSYYCA
jgi:hypothetical protein